MTYVRGGDTPTVEDVLLGMAFDRDRDMASTWNGIGFNKLDTVFGHSLAERVQSDKDLTPKQLLAAVRMLEKYRGQAESMHGLGSWDQIKTEAQERATTLSEDQPTNKGDGHYFFVRDDGRIGLQSAYYWQELVAEIKALPRSMKQWQPETREWVFPANSETIPVIEGIAEKLGIPFKGLDKLQAAKAEIAANIAGSLAVDADLELEAPEGESYLPFQRAGIAHLLRVMPKHNGFLGDEMGLGKTVQALGYMRAARTFPAIIVVPNVVKTSWRRHAEKWLPKGTNVLVLNGGPARPDRLDGADVVILNYEILTKWSEALCARQWALLVLDEAHYIKNRKAQRTKNAEEIAKHCDQKMALTGTPVLNRVTELIEPLKLLGWLGGRDRPLGTVGSFLLLYGGEHGPFGGWSGTEDPQRLARLNKRLREIGYVRRTKLPYTDAEGNHVAGVLEELPPIRPDAVPVPLVDRGEYARVEKDIREHFKLRMEGDAEFQKMVATLDDLERERARQAYLRNAVTRASKAQKLVMIEALKQAAVRGKTAQVISWVGDYLDSSEGKLLLFVWHQELARKLAVEFECPVIIGGMTDVDRQEAEEVFQTDPLTRLLVVSIPAASMGLTLTAATDVAIAELPWRPEDVNQAAGRAYGRVNDAHGINLWYLVADGTIEEEIAAILDRKRKITAAVNTGTIIEGEDESILNLVTLAVLGQKLEEEAEDVLAGTNA